MITVKHTSANTEAVRKMAAALHQVGLTGQLKVGVEGPEKWSAETPSLTPIQFTQVFADIVTMDYKGQKYTLKEFIGSAKKVIDNQDTRIKELEEMLAAERKTGELMAAAADLDETMKDGKESNG